MLIVCFTYPVPLIDGVFRYPDGLALGGLVPAILLNNPLHGIGAKPEIPGGIPAMDCSNETLQAESHGIFKVILLVYLLGHLFA